MRRYPADFLREIWAIHVFATPRNTRDPARMCRCFIDAERTPIKKDFTPRLGANFENFCEQRRINGGAWYYLGRIHFEQRDIGTAIFAFRKAAIFSPDNPNASNWLARAEMRAAHAGLSPSVDAIPAEIRTLAQSTLTDVAELDMTARYKIARDLSEIASPEIKEAPPKKARQRLPKRQIGVFAKVQEEKKRPGEPKKRRAVGDLARFAASARKKKPSINALGIYAHELLDAVLASAAEARAVTRRA